MKNTEKNAVHGYTVVYLKDDSDEDVRKSREEEEEDAEPRQSEVLPVKSPVDSQVKPRGRGRAKGYKKGKKSCIIFVELAVLKLILLQIVHNTLSFL